MPGTARPRVRHRRLERPRLHTGRYRWPGAGARHPHRGAGAGPGPRGHGGGGRHPVRGGRRRRAGAAGSRGGGPSPPRFQPTIMVINKATTRGWSRRAPSSSRWACTPPSPSAPSTVATPATGRHDRGRPAAGPADAPEPDWTDESLSPDELTELAETEMGPPRVAIVGRPNTGKVDVRESCARPGTDDRVRRTRHDPGSGGYRGGGRRLASSSGGHRRHPPPWIRSSRGSSGTRCCVR